MIYSTARLRRLLQRLGGTAQPRIAGGWEGRVWIAPDFDAAMPDIEVAFGLRDPQRSSSTMP